MTSTISLARVATDSDGRRWSQRAALMVDRWRGWVFLGIIAAYLLGFNGQWLIEPDGGLYLNLARNLARGRGYTYGGVRHETVYPGLPVALAGLYRAVPGHFIFAADVFILLCALASLALVYRLVLLAYDRPTAVVVALGVAISHDFYRYSFEILSDMPFVLGVMAVLAGHEGVFGPRAKGRWWDWMLLVAGLAAATATRPTMIGLLAAWVAALAWLAVAHRNVKAGVAIAICAAIVGIFLLFDPRRFGEHGLAGGYEQYAIFQLSHLHDLSIAAAANVRDLLSLTLAKAAFGMSLGPSWLNASLGVLAMAAAIALIRERLLWGLWVILALSTLVMFVSNERYLLPVVPMVVLGWWRLLRGINIHLPRFAGNAVFLVLLVVGMGPNVIQTIGVIAQQRSHPFLEVYQRGRYEPFARLVPAVARNTNENDIVICPPKTARMIAFLADRVCYEENEPIPWGDGNLFVIVDPADGDYVQGLSDEGIQLRGDVLANAGRSGGGIYLIRAERRP